MSDEPAKYTGHDFAELITTDRARAESLTLLLRSHGIDARAMEAGGWTIAGPSAIAVVLVPRKNLEEARGHLERSKGVAELDPPESPPAGIMKMRERRNRFRPVALGLIIIIAVLFVLFRGSIPGLWGIGR